MKKNIFLIITVITIFLVWFYFFKFKNYAFSQPGSYKDPVITKSYLDSFAKFKLQNFVKGEKIVPEEGTLFILRLGKATASSGFVDLTDGVEIPGGSALKPNHLVVCPRGDGRALFTKSNVTFLVQGRLQ